MKQIVLITDGCSNEGVDPVAAAAHAYRQGVVVNVVGILDGGQLGQRGMEEVAAIAAAGGGMSRTVHTKTLSETVQMLTRKAAMHTIQQTVQQELRQLFGAETPIEQLHPSKRGAVVHLIDTWTEQAELQVALLIDTSASMRAKLPAVEQACQDLMLSLQARQGMSSMCVLHFPGNTTAADMLTDWTSNVAKRNELFYNLNMKGTTPTGPALMQAVSYITARRDAADSDAFSREELPARYVPAAVASSRKDGIWSDYIV